MPFWLKWVALPIVGLFAAYEIIHIVLGAIFTMIIVLVLGAAVVGGVWYLYNKTIGELPAAKRRKQIKRRGY
jgi:hypothetical protein